jgi:hypothetical protein
MSPAQIYLGSISLKLPPGTRVERWMRNVSFSTEQSCFLFLPPCSFSSIGKYHLLERGTDCHRWGHLHFLGLFATMDRFGLELRATP